MTDRLVADAVAARIGTDALSRLRSLRRRLWWRRAVRSGVIALAAILLLVAVVQLLARAFPLEIARWIQGGVVDKYRRTLTLHIRNVPDGNAFLHLENPPGRGSP